MSLSNISSLEKFAKRFAPAIPQSPTGFYASIILLRETKSYAIFTTEGGQQQDTERTQAGLAERQSIDRLVMFKRKQVAPERRAGKALARQAGVFPYAIVSPPKKPVEIIYGAEAIEARRQKIEESNKGAKAENKTGFTQIDDCYLTAGLCTHCPDCLTYGYAAIEGEGARKARVMTDSCFSVRPYALIQKNIKFNVIDEQTQTSGTITAYDYMMPEVFLPSVVTTVDATLDEFVYVLGNVLRTTRYGKESTRQGFIRNHVLAIAFSDVELFANLELTQAFYDALTREVTVGNEKFQPLDLATQALARQDFETRAPQVIRQLTKHLYGRLELAQGDTLAGLLDEVEKFYQDEQRVHTFMRGLNNQSASFVV